MDFTNDKIKIFYERYLDDDGVSQRTGNIIYSEIINPEKNIILYRYEYPNGSIGYFTPEGKSIERSLMRTPINGAKLSSRYGFRIHPIIGYNQMHQGTDFAAPVGTPIRKVIKEKKGNSTWPVANKWCAQTDTDSAAIAIVAAIKPL